MSNSNLKSILKKFKLNESFISQLLGILVLVVIGMLIFNYFKGFDQETGPLEIGEGDLEELTDQDIKLIEEEGKLVPAGLPQEYVVQKGEDLWKISEKFYLSGYNWVDVAKENGLKNPNLLEAGQKITLPKVEAKQPTATQIEVVETKKTIAGDSYEVQKGDDLWNIALRAYGDGYQWARIAQTNKLANPNIIHPGNKLSLPR